MIVRKIKRQDRVDSLFDSMVHAIRATHVLGSMTSVIASLLTVTGIAVLASAPRWIDYQTFSVAGQRLESFVQVARPVAAGATISGPAVKPQGAESDADEAFPERQLNKEQTNLVKFITRKYAVEWNSAQEYVFQAFRAARDLRVDPMLILAVMSIESSFDADAQSNKGAQGLMQVLTRVHREKFAPFGGPESAFDPVANIRVGTQILRQYLSAAGGSFEQALKYYVGAAFMSDDQGYGFKVLNERQRLLAVAEGKPIPVLAAAPAKAPALSAGASTEGAAAINVTTRSMLAGGGPDPETTAVSAEPALPSAKPEQPVGAN